MSEPIIKRIAVEQLDLCHTQSRQAVREDVVEEYAEAMADGAKFPMPVVFSVNGKAPYWVADGIHRVRANMKNGYLEVDCEVHKGDLNDARMWAASSNKEHGLRRTNEDKARSVKMFLAAMTAKGLNLSDRAVAEAVGVSAATVYKYREASGAQIEHLPRAGQDGKTYPATTAKKESGANRSHLPDPEPDAGDNDYHLPEPDAHDDYDDCDDPDEGSDYAWPAPDVDVEADPPLQSDPTPISAPADTEKLKKRLVKLLKREVETWHPHQRAVMAAVMVDLAQRIRMCKPLD